MAAVLPEDERDCQQILTLANLMGCDLIPTLPEIRLTKIIVPDLSSDPSRIASIVCLSFWFNQCSNFAL